MARGSKHATACGMTKWFDKHYHYLVPEWEGSEPKLNFKPLEHDLEVKEWAEGQSVTIGPYTFIRLSNVDESAALYAQLLQSHSSMAEAAFQVREKHNIPTL
ncbi:hypothetical protein [Metabacillus sp. FJAT-52054]|uniref:Cobalamin-independent methionine synthase MetE N-terminal domain-containing protein n=1 Tax=Metabacillus sediminis TaxID=3117746 RepID=A0ABZ2NLK3_9BACI